MSATTARGVDSDVLIRDLRHMDARAASDLADWLVHLELEGKADRTLYGYTRARGEFGDKTGSPGPDDGDPFSERVRIPPCDSAARSGGQP
jgi:hypothetical protein